MVEIEIKSSDLIEPINMLNVELISYYPAINNKQSNFYVLKEIEHNDTIYVIDKEACPIADFIKEYKGVENTWIILQKSDIRNKKKSYLVNIPINFNIVNRKVYLGELIRLTD